MNWHEVTYIRRSIHISSILKLWKIGRIESRLKYVFHSESLIVVNLNIFIVFFINRRKRHFFVVVIAIVTYSSSSLYGERLIIILICVAVHHAALISFYPLVCIWELLFDIFCNFALYNLFLLF